MAVAPAWSWTPSALDWSALSLAPQLPHPLFKVWGGYCVEPDNFGALATNTEGPVFFPA
jgi:hypothetical protein